MKSPLLSKQRLISSIVYMKENEIFTKGTLFHFCRQSLLEFKILSSILLYCHFMDMLELLTRKNDAKKTPSVHMTTISVNLVHTLRELPLYSELKHVW